MTTPNARFRKQDGNTGVVRPGNEGVTALAAASSAGPTNTAVLHVDENAAKTEFPQGPLAEFAAILMPITQKGCVLVRPDPSTAGAYGAITEVGDGTSAVTAGATEPYDNFDVFVKFITGGTIGVAGATYQYSLNGGKTMSKTTALGVATSIVIPDTNVTIELGAGTVLANQTIAFKTTRPLMTNDDLPDTLEALRVTNLDYESILLDMHADDDTVALLVTWIGTINNQGKFPVVFATVRPMGAAETETEYKTALETMLADAACVDLVLCADEDDLVSAFRGISQPRPAGLSVAAHSMAVDIGVEPAWVELGPLRGASIADARGNPHHHNEEKYPGLDDLRLTTLRTIEGFTGVYITNTRLFSPVNSDFVFLPHARVVNRAAKIGRQVLTKQLSRGVTKEPKAGPDGERYISDAAAKIIEALVQDAIDPAVRGQVDDLKFRISRTDDIRSNQGVKVKCFLESVALAYVKEWDVTVRYVTQITAPTAQ